MLLQGRGAGRRLRVVSTCGDIPTELTQLAIDDLHTFKGNPRRGDVSQIAVSLTKHGQPPRVHITVGGRKQAPVAG